MDALKDSGERKPKPAGTEGEKQEERKEEPMEEGANKEKVRQRRHFHTY